MLNGICVDWVASCVVCGATSSHLDPQGPCHWKCKKIVYCFEAVKTGAGTNRGVVSILGSSEIDVAYRRDERPNFLARQRSRESTRITQEMGEGRTQPTNTRIRAGEEPHPRFVGWRNDCMVTWPTGFSSRWAGCDKLGEGYSLPQMLFSCVA